MNDGAVAVAKLHLVVEPPARAGLRLFGRGGEQLGLLIQLVTQVCVNLRSVI